MQATQHDWYAVLGVQSDASQETITRKYREQLLKLHPDVRPAEEQVQANDDVALLNLAYEVLGHEGRRREYDRERQQAATPPPSPGPPPPPPPPSVVVEPTGADYGAVLVGCLPADLQVVIHLSDGSPISACELVTSEGQFWRAVLLPGTATTLMVLLRCKPLSKGAAPGVHADELRLRVEQTDVVVPVTITALKARRSSDQRAQRQHPVLTLLTWVLCLLGGLLLVRAHGWPTEQSAARYCVRPTDRGKTLSYFRVEGNASESTAPAVWKLRAGNTGRDQFVYWWTPAVGYWERANVQPGLVRDGWTYGRYEYVEVRVNDRAGWQYLDAVLGERQSPLDSATERNQRERFLTDWIGNLDVERCSPSSQA
ncbi:J domain-containing protein [Streptomyces sp. NPDC057257]|uniref:J domain-containing protein n=1 Tax=Streptomyces sp. NPDC057257 TaxID=3346071 RepID=UPI00363E86C8